MNALDTKVKNDYQLSSWMVGNRVALVLAGKILAPLLAMLLIVLCSVQEWAGMESELGSALFMFFFVTFWVNLAIQLERGDRRVKDRKKDREVHAHRRMRELGLKGRPWPIYFWEAEPRYATPALGQEDIAVRIHKLTRADSYGSPIRGYLLSEVESTLVSVVEDKDGDQLPKLSSVTVGSQYISSCDPEDPELDGMISPENVATLTRAQTWVNQLNADSEAEYRLERKRRKAGPAPELQEAPEPTPLEIKLARLETVQQRTLANR